MSRLSRRSVIAGLGLGLCVGAGYLFGNIPAVKKNFELVVLAIILVSILPILIETVQHRRRGRIIAVKDAGGAR